MIPDIEATGLLIVVLLFRGCQPPLIAFGSLARKSKQMGRKRLCSVGESRCAWTGSAEALERSRDTPAQKESSISNVSIPGRDRPNGLGLVIKKAREEITGKSRWKRHSRRHGFSNPGIERAASTTTWNWLGESTVVCSTPK
jgi:hypothetical protein